MDWKTESLETLAFHEKMQKENGKGKRGRPESISGKKGWGIRDTAKAKKISYKWAHDLISWGKALRTDPLFDNKVVLVTTRTVTLGTFKKHKLAELLGILRGKILILKSDKRTVKIGQDLEEAVRQYEQ